MPAHNTDTVRKLFEDIEFIKRHVTASSEATRHASNITVQDLDALEAALRICFIPTEDGPIEEAASQSMSNLTEFTWEVSMR